MFTFSWNWKMYGKCIKYSWAAISISIVILSEASANTTFVIDSVKYKQENQMNVLEKCGLSETKSSTDFL